MRDNSSICAIATAPGNGAIAMIRISGEDSISVSDKVFLSIKKNKKLINQKANTIHFGTIKNDNKIIDEVLVSVFREPYSYTGENMVEISCHGSGFIQQKILEALIQKGSRAANPGEFTQRAFLNGKLDLSQAEGVADLIASESEASHKIAFEQMRGGFSSEINKLRSNLLNLISLLELELDFSEEDVEFADRKELKNLLSKISKKNNHLLDSFSLGNVIKNGIPVAIVGNTNVGKSTLLNILLREDRAIVSEIAGTTRDSIEDIISIDGITFRFIDTAGLRETTDTIERIGIDRTKEKIKQASIVLLMVDASDAKANIQSSINDIKSGIGDKQLIIVVNKMDLLHNKPFKIDELDGVDTENDTIIYISAKVHSHIDLLIDSLLKRVKSSYLKHNNIIVSNARHYEALKNSNLALKRACSGLESNIATDLLAMDIRQVLHYLGEITGEFTNDEILGNIFKNFCIGK